MLAAESVDLVAVYGPAALPILGLIAALKWLITELRAARAENVELRTQLFDQLPKTATLAAEAAAALNRAAELYEKRGPDAGAA